MTAGKGPYEYPGCEQCADARTPCPYWCYDYDTREWIHDTSGIRGYLNDAVFGSPDISGNIPKTDDDDQIRRRW